MKKQQQWLCEGTPKAAFNSTADVKAFSCAALQGVERMLLDLRVCGDIYSIS